MAEPHKKSERSKLGELATPAERRAARRGLEESRLDVDELEPLIVPRGTIASEELEAAVREGRE